MKKFKMALTTFYNHLILQSHANYHCSYANEVVSDLIKAGCFEEAEKCNMRISGDHCCSLGSFFLTQAISASWNDST